MAPEVGEIGAIMSVPNFPVIVQHLRHPDGLTVCSGDPMPEVDPKYDATPRYLCMVCGQTMKKVLLCPTNHHCSDPNFCNCRCHSATASRYFARLDGAQ